MSTLIRKSVPPPMYPNANPNEEVKSIFSLDATPGRSES